MLLLLFLFYNALLGMNFGATESKELNGKTKALFEEIQLLYQQDIKNLTNEKNNFFKTKKFLLPAGGGAVLSVIAFSKIPHFSLKQKCIGFLATSFFWGSFSFLAGGFFLENRINEKKKNKEGDVFNEEKDFNSNLKKLQDFIRLYNWKNEEEKKILKKKLLL